MRTFFACFSGEFKKLCLKKKYIVLSIIGAAICVLFTLISLLAGRLVGRLINMNDIGSVVQNLPMTILPLFAQVIIPLVAAMAVCDLFASEYHDLSVKAQLIRPVTRFKIYMAKTGAVFVMCAIMSVVAFVVSAICNTVAVHSVEGLTYAFFAYLVDLIPLIIIIGLAALINQCTKSSTSAMFLCIIIYVLIKACGIFIPILDSLMFTGYMQWHKLWMGIPLPPMTLIAKCVLLLGYGITFFSGGYCMFLKREF